MNFKFLFSLLAVFALTLPLSNVNAQGVSIDQGKLYFNGIPGETQTKEIILTNPTSEPVLFQLSFSDWVRDTFGIKHYSGANSLDHSCASWMNLPTTSIELPPMGEKSLVVEMAPPSDFTPDMGVQNSMLFIRQIRDPLAAVETGDNLQSSIDVAFQIGVHVYYVHPSLQQQEIAIKGFQFENDNNQPVESKLMLKLENVGETIVDGRIKVELTHGASGKEYRLFTKHPISASFMPKDVRYVALDLPEDLPEGTYSALAIVDIGPSHELQMAVIDIEIPRN